MFLVQLPRFDRVKLIVHNMIALLHKQIVSLNIFFLRDFGNNTDRVTFKRLGQWSTRLYIVLLLISLTTVALYIIAQSYAYTNTYDKPSFNFYNQLRQKYGNKLKCSCSMIAPIYNQFVKIKPIFHQVRKRKSTIYVCLC